MSASFTISSSESVTFSVTHARYLSAKVATDLKRIQRLYGSPSDSDIVNYEAELTEFLKAGYLDTVTYGYRRDGIFIEPTLRYTAQDLASGVGTDDDPGKIRPSKNIDGARFGSYMTYTDAYNSLSSEKQAAFKAKVPINRSTAPQPGVSGYYASDSIYSSGGRALNRSSVRSY